MSFTLFDATGLTTTADRRRRPALSRGQLLRTLFLFMLCVVALALATRSSRAADDGSGRFVGFDHASADVTPNLRLA